jgi:hypothetical protein
MPVLAVFGIENDGLNLAVNLLLLFLVVLWFALVYWTYADARRRIADPMLVGCSAAAAMFPFVGTIVYLVVRPPEYLDDVRERELEIAAAEARLAGIEQQSCPYCSFEIEKSFLRCPSCLRRLKEPCGVCGKPLDPRWKLCPYCEAEVAQAAPPPAAPARPRRARPAASEPPTRETLREPPLRETARDTARAPRPASGSPPKPAAAPSTPPARQPRPARPAPRPSDGRRTERPAAADTSRPDQPAARPRTRPPSAG